MDNNLQPSSNQFTAILQMALLTTHRTFKKTETSSYRKYSNSKEKRKINVQT
jgi:hypothetical protein